MSSAEISPFAPGVLILAIPDLSVVTIAMLFGIALVARGAIALVEAMRLRRLLSRRRPRGALASP